MILYTDGSYNKKISRDSTAYSAVIVTNESLTEYIVDIIYGVVTDPLYVSMWNVGGEIWGVLAGSDYIINQYKVKDISLYYDYIGLGKWATGEWRTKNPATQSYARYMKNIMNDYNLTLNKVPGHSNILLNEVADKYANNGTKKFLKSGETSTLLRNIHIPRK